MTAASVLAKCAREEALKALTSPERTTSAPSLTTRPDKVLRQLYESGSENLQT